MRVPWTTRVADFLRGPHPLHHSIWHGRLSPLTFRRFEAADLPRCLELYSLNKPARFPDLPPGGDYETSLRSGRLYTLVAEKAGRLIASGSIVRYANTIFATLCFGLVHPEYHGQGMGTSLLFCRLALLKPSEPDHAVLIFAVSHSIGFYRRFAFVPVRSWKDKHGCEHPSGLCHVTGRDIVRCRKLLSAHSISFPMDEDAVPIVPLDQPSPGGGE